MKQDNICHVPVTAIIKIIDGKAVMVSAEYADIPAEEIAAYLIEHRGGETM
ncbi:hypothetical protein [Ruminococcus flavefaciens]|uniref:hypothetical protein n=1 Tax=Ruminococcus flavefaciens TaxID=1265 RepID=UPI0026EF6E7F|nr:hypothetical protein [Ruminococcus flavefaciens]